MLRLRRSAFVLAASIAASLALIGCGGDKTAAKLASVGATTVSTTRPSAPSSTSTATTRAGATIIVTTTTATTTTTTRSGGVVTTTAAGAPASVAGPATGNDCPAGYPVKGNISSTDRIYHVKGSSSSYDATKPEVCFATPAAAEAAGFRASKT